MRSSVLYNYQRNKIIALILKMVLFSALAIFSSSTISEDKPRLILLTVKGENIDLAVRNNIRVAIEQALTARYTVYSGSQVDQKIEREFVKQCRIYYDDAEMANSECMKSVAGFFVADYIATPQISAQTGGYLLTLEIRDAYTSESFDPYSDNCIDCGIIDLADAFRAMIATKNSSGSGIAPVFISQATTTDDGASGVVDLTSPVKPQDRGKLALLLLDSIPPGAEVWLGDIKAGNTPYQNLELSSGQNLNITLKAQDYVDLPVQLTLKPGSNIPEPFQLIPAFGSLSIVSEPSGADVYISGILVGQTPYKNSRLGSAKYLADIRKHLYRPLNNQTITIENGIHTELSYKLQPNFGTLSIASVPGKVDISVKDGTSEVYKGSTPASLQLEPGTYILHASKDGYTQRRFEVNIARGKRTSINREQLQLRQLLGTVIIASEPAVTGARVLIDGKDLGAVPLITELPVGKYQVAIKADQFSGKSELLVQEGKRQKLLVKLRTDHRPSNAAGDVTSLSLTGFNYKSSSNAQMPREITVAYFLEWPTPNQFGQVTGAYEEAMGVEINWRAFDTGTAMSAAMASGDVHIAFSQGVPPFVVATSAGLDIEMVDVAVSYSENDNCVVHSSQGIDKGNVSALEGQKIAVPIGTAAHFGMLKQMAHFGVDISSFQVVDMFPAEGAAALARGDLAMACGWGRSLRRMKKYGNVLLTGAEKEALGIRVFDVTSISADFGRDYPDLVAKFLRVTAEMNYLYARHPDSMVDEIAKAAGMNKDATVATLSGFRFPTLGSQLGPDWLGGGTQAFLKELADFFVAQGALDSALVTYTPVVNTSYLEAAARM